MAKQFSSLRKGDVLYVWRERRLYECPITRIERCRPATLPAYGQKWINHTDQPVYMIHLYVSETDKYSILEQNFRDKTKRFVDEDGECEVVGTDKETLKKVVVKGLESNIDYAIKQLDQALAEFEKKE